MSLEDDMLNDIEGNKKKEVFEDNVKLSASDIQKQRQQLQSKTERKRNLANNPADKLKRHAVIKSLMDTNQAGNETPSEIQKALAEKGINISLVTVCKDLREISKISTHSIKKIDNMLVGTLKGYLNKLDTIAEESDSDETRIRAINAAFDDTKKLYDVLDAIATRTVLEETEKAKLGRLGNPVNEIIQFIDSPERVNKDIYYTDERNKIVEWLQESIGSLIEGDGKMYKGFSNPTAYNTFINTTDKILEIIRQLKDVPYRKKQTQQEGDHKDNNIKMDK